MPSALHETLVLLFRSSPRVVAELLREAAGVVLPQFTRARIASVDRSEAQPATRLADLVVAFENERSIQAAVIVEVQLQRKPRKRYTWPLYVASVRAELRCPTYLVVFTIDEATADWASKSIAMGHPDWSLRPIVVGPAGVPLITDTPTARQLPELAILSVLAHGRGDHAYEVGKAAMHGMDEIDDDRVEGYTDLVLHALDQGARAQLEELMALENYPEPTNFLLRIRARTRAEDVLAVLVTRGLPVSDDIEARIRAEQDLDTLSTWHTRAVTVDRAEDIFED